MEQTNNNTNIDKEARIAEILDAFKIFDGVYKKEAIDAAIELKEEITPHLIGILEKVLADPEVYVENEKLYDHIYAVMLLGHFKEPKAHKAIAGIFSLPDDIPERLFGDITTDTLPYILVNTCGGSVELLKSMATDRSVYDYCRISALDAMAFAVLEGIVPRETVLSLFETLFTGDETNRESDFWGLLACTIGNLYPRELMETLKKAYEDDLISPGLIGYEELEDDVKLGREKCLERLRKEFERSPLDDLHAHMSRWACFKEKVHPTPSVIAAKQAAALKHYKSSGKTKSKTKAGSKKKKRKQAKASQKKNRRR